MADIVADLVPWVLFIVPFAVFAFVIHLLERIIQSRLAFRFGWNSILFTGWLGTPIHELSHVLFCIVFGHRIDEVKLFQPDRQSGRLGFVRHSYKKNSWFQEFGNFFIGIAPLLGGTVVLIVLLLTFYPNILTLLNREDFTSSQSWLERIFLVAQSTLKEILQISNFFTVRFWLFMYLTLCVSSHMAPSRSDYEGASKGSIILFVALLITAVTLSLLGLGDSVRWVLGSILRPMIGVYSIAILLCLIGLVVVFVLTSVYDLLTMKEQRKG